MESIENFSINQLSIILDLKKSQAANLRSGKREITSMESLLLAQAAGEQGINFFDWKVDERIYWNNLTYLQDELEFNDKSFAKLFNHEQRRFRFLRAHCRSLAHFDFLNFCRRFDLAYEIFFSKSFDAKCLASNIKSPFHSNAYLPKRFEGGGSKMRTLSNAFDFVNSEFGNETAHSLRRSMQVPKEALSFPEKEISIRIFAEIHRRLRMFGASDEVFIKMGSFNQFNKRNKRMYSQSAKLSGLSLHSALKEFFGNAIKTIDRNVHFKVLHATTESFVLETVPGEVFKNAFIDGEYDSAYEIGLYRLGHIKVIPTYFGFNQLQDELLEFEEKTGRCVYKYKINI